MIPNICGRKISHILPNEPNKIYSFGIKGAKINHPKIKPQKVSQDQFIFKSNHAQHTHRSAISSNKHQSVIGFSNDLLNTIAINKISKVLKEKITITREMIEGLIPDNILSTKAKNINPIYINDIKKVIKGEPYIKTFDKLSSEKVFVDSVVEGEMVILKEKVGFIDKDKNFKALKIKAGTFKNLFPPGLRYSISQSEYTGNCYFLTSLYDKLSSTKKQHELYSMFEQNGDKITVTIPKGNRFPVEFDIKNTEWASDETLSDSCLGIKMLELTHSINRYLGSLNEDEIDSALTKGLNFNTLSEYANQGRMAVSGNNLSKGSPYKFVTYGETSNKLPDNIVEIGTRKRRWFRLLMSPNHSISAQINPSKPNEVKLVDPHNTLKVKSRKKSQVAKMICGFTVER